ncbi:FAD-dependent oxidoreductase [Halogeometricum borinquense]|uniref:FAD-dependent oxidoreductase n=1 Tax=Halogeometricum borinquense TaxID=60847 RepID=A0A6C0UN83_9EURY|nr:NAD(P)/FAD-dependent oxidoreductase [Halogeometricum borinquense]QIB74388.1 FAD-dependent oxidoreductase [Halogeometricum borinquense]
MSNENAGSTQDAHDVVVVGGGPAGCSAAVFAARYGFDTVVFDRGRSSLRHCGYLENYLGFPGGIDIDAFYTLMHDHVEAAGCTIVPELVSSVEREGDEFRIETQDGTVVRAPRVVAATKYDADYLDGLDEELLQPDGHGGMELDPSFSDADGSTPVDGLYVAGPISDVEDQAIIAAGHGARVGRRLLADARRNHGYWDAVAAYYDWVRKESTLTEEWRDRDRWRELFDEHFAPDDGGQYDPSHIERVREEYIDERKAKYATDEEIARRTEAGTEQLVDSLGAERLLDAIDDDRIRAYLDD